MKESQNLILYIYKSKEFKYFTFKIEINKYLQISDFDYMIRRYNNIMIKYKIYNFNSILKL